MELIIICVIVYVIYRTATKDKREAAKAAAQQQKEDIIKRMSSDPQVLMMVENICELLTDLKSPLVGLLRTDDQYYLIFASGSVYIQMRWRVSTADGFENMHKEECILDRVRMGKNPLGKVENHIFADLIVENLKKNKWIKIDTDANYDYLRQFGNYDRCSSYRISKGAEIPEAF